MIQSIGINNILFGLQYSNVVKDILRIISRCNPYQISYLTCIVPMVTIGEKTVSTCCVFDCKRSK